MVGGTEHEVVPPTVGLKKGRCKIFCGNKRTTSGSSFHHLTGFQQDITNHPPIPARPSTRWLDQSRRPLRSLTEEQASVDQSC
jgi:hypothetical protein